MNRTIAIGLSLLLLAACTAAPVYRDGIYQGTARGHNGNIVVQVTIADDQISDVAILEHNETQNQAFLVLDILPQIVETQSTDVDIIAGATVTGEALLEAVDQALAEAKQQS